MHTWRNTGYDFWETEAEIRNWGGLVVVWRAAKGWKVEGTAIFGPNVVSFYLRQGQDDGTL